MRRKLGSKLWMMAAVVLVIGLAGYSQADTITFIGADAGAGSSDPRPNSDAAAAAFDVAASAIGSLTIIDFEASPLGVFNDLVVAPGVTMDGNHGGSDQQIVDTPTGTPDNIYGYNTTSGGSQWVDLYGGTLTFSFDPGVNSFGSFISGLQGTIVGQQTVAFYDGSTEYINIPLLSSGVAFVGFTAVGKEISSITFNVINDIVGVDDVRFTRGAAVPTPSSLAALLGMGLMGLVTVVRRRHKKA